MLSGTEFTATTLVLLDPKPWITQLSWPGTAVNVRRQLCLYWRANDALDYSTITT